MSVSDIFVKSDNCEQKFVLFFPKPSYHPNNKDVIIISTNHCGIYEYNMKRNTFNKIYTYKQGFGPHFHGQFIDAKNESLYIFGYGELGIFDLNAKIMNTNTQN
eukprot:255176_1